jgi:hypothetical protein
LWTGPPTKEVKSQLFNLPAQASGTVGNISDCRSEGLEFDPYSGQNKVVFFFVLSTSTNTIVLIVQADLLASFVSHHKWLSKKKINPPS